MSKYIKVILKKITNLIQRLLNPLDNYIRARYSEEKISFPPVFIVGAPRTGSTILFQLLSYSGRFSYFDNFSAFFYKIIVLATWIDHKLFAQKKHHSFTSSFGKSNPKDIRAPHECGQFWYRWLPKNHHYVTRDDISSTSKTELQNNIVACTNIWQKPFLFKNLNAGQRLDVIAELFPDAHIIWIKRDPSYTVQSIIEARKKLQIDANAWWSIRPKNYQELIRLPELQRSIQQGFFLEQQIYKDLSLFPSSQVHTINYKQLCTAPQKTVEQLLNNLPGAKTLMIENEIYKNIFYDTRQLISDSDLKVLTSYVNQHDWTNYDY